ALERALRYRPRDREIVAVAGAHAHRAVAAGKPADPQAGAPVDHRLLARAAVDGRRQGALRRTASVDVEGGHDARPFLPAAAAGKLRPLALQLAEVLVHPRQRGVDLAAEGDRAPG